MSDCRNTSRYALVLLLASALTVQVWAHGGEDHGDEKKSTPAPVAVDAVNAVNAQGQVTFIEPALRLPDGSVFVPKSAQRQLALRTQAARKGEFPRTVELNGRVVGDPNAGGRVQTFQSGRIEAGPKGLAVLGQRVSKGQVLAWLQPASAPSNAVRSSRRWPNSRPRKPSSNAVSHASGNWKAVFRRRISSRHRSNSPPSKSEKARSAAASAVKRWWRRSAVSSARPTPSWVR
jgi:hypothetical protein